MRRDTIFYQLFRQSPTLLFDLIPDPPLDILGYTFDSVEVKETAFRIDGVFTPPTPAGIVYFCEVQFQTDKLLYERMMRLTKARQVQTTTRTSRRFTSYCPLLFM